MGRGQREAGTVTEGLDGHVKDTAFYFKGNSKALGSLGQATCFNSCFKSSLQLPWEAQTGEGWGQRKIETITQIQDTEDAEGVERGREKAIFGMCLKIGGEDLLMGSGEESRLTFMDLACASGSRGTGSGR